MRYDHRSRFFKHSNQFACLQTAPNKSVFVHLAQTTLFICITPLGEHEKRQYSFRLYFNVVQHQFALALPIGVKFKIIDSSNCTVCTIR